LLGSGAGVYPNYPPIKSPTLEWAQCYSEVHKQMAMCLPTKDYEDLAIYSIETEGQLRKANKVIDAINGKAVGSD
jgi:hypothetical protein